MRILILGGTAFVSKEMARQAVAAGHQVTCPARGISGGPPPGAEWARADRPPTPHKRAALPAAVESRLVDRLRKEAGA